MNPVPRQTILAVDAAVRAVFGAEAAINARDLIGGDRGIFSDLVLISLDGPPGTLVAKTVRSDRDGRIAADAGFDRNEDRAYRLVGPHLGSLLPRFYGSHAVPGGPLVLLIEDLSGARWLDQLVGCDREEVGRVAGALVTVGAQAQLAKELRRPLLVELDGERLAEGLSRIRGHWSSELSPEAIGGYRSLHHRWEEAARLYDELDDLILCHGDPRADNIAIDGERLVLADWQQAHLGPRGSDLAWFLATSLDRNDRALRVQSGMQAYRDGMSWGRLRTALSRPALMSMLLATRNPESARGATTIIQTLDRIGSLLGELS